MRTSNSVQVPLFLILRSCQYDFLVCKKLVIIVLPANLLHKLHYCPSLKVEFCVMNGIKWHLNVGKMCVILITFVITTRKHPQQFAK